MLVSDWMTVSEKQRPRDSRDRLSNRSKLETGEGRERRDERTKTGNEQNDVFAANALSLSTAVKVLSSSSLK